MTLTENLHTRIETIDCNRSVFVDKHNENEVWLSIQVRGGSANCVIPRDQALAMIEAIKRVLDGEQT